MNFQNLVKSRNVALIASVVGILIAASLLGWLTFSLESIGVAFSALATFYPLFLALSYWMTLYKVEPQERNAIKRLRNITSVLFVVSALLTGAFAWHLTSSLKFGALVASVPISFFPVLLAASFTVAATKAKLKELKS